MFLDFCTLCDPAQWILAVATGVLATVLVWLYDQWKWRNDLRLYQDDYVRVESKQYGGGPDHDLELQSVMRLVRIRYTGHRLLSIQAKYWPDMPLAIGRVEFPLSKFVGNGNYWYTDRTSFGRWKMELYPDSFPDEIRMYYDGTKPEVRGYEVLKRRSKLTQADLPSAYQGRYSEWLAKLDAEFSDKLFEKRKPQL